MNTRTKLICLFTVMLQGGCKHYEMTSYGYDEVRSPLLFHSEQACTHDNRAQLFFRCFLKSRSGLVLIPTGELTMINMESGEVLSSSFGDLV